MDNHSDIIRVIIVDDHSIVIRGIRDLLRRERYRRFIEVVGEALSGEDAIDCIKNRDGQVDVVVMDVEMPGLGGIPATRLIRERWPNCNVVLLTGFNRVNGEGIRAGARGYALKNASDEEIIEAIKSARAGTTYVQPSIKDLVISSVQMVIEPLTDRERQILEDMREGLTNPKIAVRRGISEHTVKDHVKTIIAKLGADNRTQAVVNAIEHGVLK